MTIRDEQSSAFSSSRSRQYEINSSTMFSQANKFKISGDFTHNDVRFKTLFVQFSLDLGRFDVKFGWINNLRLFVFPFFLILASCGFIIIDTSRFDTITRNIYNVLKYILIFFPEDTSFHIMLLFNLMLLIIYISLVFFLIYIMYRYRQKYCISLFETYLFVIVSRVIFPILTAYISHMVSMYIYEIIFEDRSNSIYMLIISLILIIVQLTYIFLSCGAYNATPLIRKHDITQLWFAHSVLDWQLNIILLVIIFIQIIFQFLSKEIHSILFTIVICVLGIVFAVKITYSLPYIHPTANSIILSSALCAPFCGICPTLACYIPEGMAYYLILIVVIIIISVFVGRLIINIRMNKIISRFAALKDHEDTEDHHGNLVLAMMRQHVNPNVNFELLNIRSDSDISLLIRIGFLFNNAYVTNSQLIAYGIQFTGKADFIFSSIQVALELQNDIMLLTNLHQHAIRVTKGPFNSVAFTELYNILRQELLTQLNQPLLNAITQCKRANRSLQHSIADFWGAVLKQKIETLLLLLPEISDSSWKVELLYLRLARNYSSSPTVYREIVMFYHKSYGDHHKTIRYQNISDKIKNNQYGAMGNASNSENSTRNTSATTDIIDHEFMEKIEPFVAAQDLIMSLPSPSSPWLYTIVILVFITMLAMPAVILGISLNDIERFHNAFQPVQVIGELETAVTRIPQLVRRRNLFEIDNILPYIEETGPPRFVHQEFIEKEDIIPALENYYNELKSDVESFLDLCSPDSIIYDACSNSTHISYVGSSIVQSTIYDMLLAFESSLSNIISNQDTFNWSSAHETSDLIYILQNFDEIFNGIKDITVILTDEINDYRNYFSKLTMIWLIILWAFPFVIILPLTLIAGSCFRREVTFILKMFFQIPKNEISNIRWALKSKKGNNNFNLNKEYVSSGMSIASTSSAEFSEFVEPHEKLEDMMDSLSTTPRTITGLTGGFAFHLFVIVIFTCVISTIGIVVFESSTISLIDMSNSYVSSINVFSSTLASYVWTQELFAKNPLLFDKPTLKQKTYAYVQELVTLYNAFLFGLNTSENTPSLLLGNDVIETFLQSTTLEYNTSNDDIDPLYGLIHNVYITLSCEAQVRIFSEMTSWLVAENPQQEFSFSDEFVYHYEHLLFSHLDLYLSDIKDLFDSKTTSLNNSKTDVLILIFLLMFLVQLLYYFTFIISSFRTLLRHLKCPRHLLLLIQPEALLKAQSLIKWLSGVNSSVKFGNNSKFANSNNENVNNKGINFDFIIENSKCGLLLTSSSLKVEKINSMTCQLFKSTEENIIGKNLLNLLQENLINKDKKKIIHNIINEIKKIQEGNTANNKIELEATILGTNSQLQYVELVIEGLQDNSIDELTSAVESFSVIIVDSTTEHFQKALIASEKAKSEQLITSLMPPAIAKRLHDGETDISFEVQEATVLFTAVHRWNETIKDLSAVDVVAFLNKLFSSYDEAMHKYPPITKLKTIGHIYMVCGGLFTDSTVNSANVVLDYALDLLNIVKKLNDEGSIKFGITIGLNTGGPINCGILGHTRPVFDIIGDSVNVASRMNSSGVSGLIQISDSTYNKIKFMSYNIKERGEIQIKGKGLRKTYLVSSQPFNTLGNSIINASTDNLLKIRDSKDQDISSSQNTSSIPLRSISETDPIEPNYVSPDE